MYERRSLILLNHFEDLQLQFEKLLPVLIELSDQFDLDVFDLAVDLLLVRVAVLLHSTHLDVYELVQLLEHHRRDLFHHAVDAQLHHFIEFSVELVALEAAGHALINNYFLEHEGAIVFHHAVREARRLQLAFAGISATIRFCVLYLNIIVRDL